MPLILSLLMFPFVRNANVCVKEFLFDVLITQGPNFVLMKMSKHAITEPSAIFLYLFLELLREGLKKSMAFSMPRRPSKTFP